MTSGSGAEISALDALWLEVDIPNFTMYQNSFRICVLNTITQKICSSATNAQMFHIALKYFRNVSDTLYK